MYEIQERLNIIARDNGSGFIMNEIKPGNGIANMKKRAAEIGADFKMHFTLSALLARAITHRADAGGQISVAGGKTEYFKHFVTI